MTEESAAARVPQQNVRDRVGLAIDARDASDGLRKVREAEAAGVRQVWMTMGGAGGMDPLTFYAAAASQTDRIRLGTSIIPIFPRHPMVVAQQVLAIHDLAPGRFRLGLGPSHQQIIEGKYGLPMPSPLSYLREYAAVLRSALWEGKVEHHGGFFSNVTFTLPRTARVPLLFSALRERAFRVAGGASDGAISWACPPHYLIEKALPALTVGAAASHRPTPPLVAQVQVAMSTDMDATRTAALGRLRSYAAMPFYARMFADAGFPAAPDGSGRLDGLADALIISGDEVKVRQRMLDLLASGLDELLITLLPVANEEDERRRLFHTIDSL